MTGRVGSTDEPEPDRLAGRLLFAGLLVLALGATAILVLSESSELLRVAVLAGLWAALIGALVAAKYRGQAGARQGEVSDLRELYELELEREVAARREFELELEAKSAEQSLPDAHATQMAELREELRALRSQLESLLGGEVLVERLSLQAQATRMRALEGQGSTSSASVERRQQRSLAAAPVVESRPVANGRANGSQTMHAEPVEPSRREPEAPAARERAERPAPETRRRPAQQPGPPSRQPVRRAPAQPEATEQWQPFGDAAPPVRTPKTPQRGESDLPRRSPGAETWPDPNAGQPAPTPSRATRNRLDQTWTPSWEAENGQDALRWPTSSQAIRREQPAAQRQPAQPAQPQQSQQLRRPEPPAERPAYRAPAEPSWAEQAAAGESTNRHAAPASGGGRRRKPEPEEQPPSYPQSYPQYEEPTGRRHRTEEAPTGRRHRPEEPPAEPNPYAYQPSQPPPGQPEPSENGGRRRKPDAYADPEVSAGFTIREEPAENGNSRHGGERNGSSGGSHTQGLSVSELLAAHGSSGGGRRRRRED